MTTLDWKALPFPTLIQKNSIRDHNNYAVAPDLGDWPLLEHRQVSKEKARVQCHKSHPFGPFYVVGEVTPTVKSRISPQTWWLPKSGYYFRKISWCTLITWFYYCIMFILLLPCVIQNVIIFFIYNSCLQLPVLWHHRMLKMSHCVLLWC